MIQHFNVPSTEYELFVDPTNYCRTIFALSGEYCIPYIFKTVLLETKDLIFQSYFSSKPAVPPLLSYIIADKVEEILAIYF